MRVSWSWSWLLVLAACSGEGSPVDAGGLPDCGGAVALASFCHDIAELASNRQSVDLGSVAVSSTSPAASVTISNTGSGPSGAITSLVTGADAMEFVVNDNCDTLLPQGTCTVAVTFKPTTAGSKTATLFVSSSPGGMISIGLTGVATM